MGFVLLRLPFVKLRGQGPITAVRDFTNEITSRIRNLLRNQENSVEHDGMHVAKPKRNERYDTMSILHDE